MVKITAPKLRINPQGKSFKGIVIGLLIALIIASYILFFYSPKCDTEQCFLDKLWKCQKTSFVKETINSTWAYEIQGSIADTCEIKVKPIKFSAETEMLSKTFEGKEMVCYIPLGSSFMPETKIEYCHGLLKEAIQDRIIERMHLYLVQNIGKLGQNLTAPTA